MRIMAFSCAMEDRYALERNRSRRLLDLVDLNLDTGCRSVLNGLPSFFGDTAETSRFPLVAFVRSPENDCEDSGTGSKVTQRPLLDVVCFESDFIDAFTVGVYVPCQFVRMRIDPHGRGLVSKIQDSSVGRRLTGIPESIVWRRPCAFVCAWV